MYLVVGVAPSVGAAAHDGPTIRIMTRRTVGQFYAPTVRAAAGTDDD